jgi:hypothetical protein
VPVGFTTFPGEIWASPRSWVETVYPGLAYFNEAERAVTSPPGRSRSSSPRSSVPRSARCARHQLPQGPSDRASRGKRALRECLAQALDGACGVLPRLFRRSRCARRRRVGHAASATKRPRPGRPRQPGRRPEPVLTTRASTEAIDLRRLHARFREFVGNRRRRGRCTATTSTTR